MKMNLKMLSEKLIQKALYNKFSSHEYKFTNVFYFDNESDWLSFLPSGFCYEVEIKISRSDFKADFKKQKHNIHSSKGKKYYTVKGRERSFYDPNWEFCKCFPELIESKEYSNHRSYQDTIIKLHFTPYCEVSFKSFDNDKLPNKFFYAVPKGLISRDEVPEYAGLLYIDENLNVEKVKDGKFIHKDILKPEKLWNKTYYAYQRELVRNLQ